LCAAGSRFATKSQLPKTKLEGLLASEELLAKAPPDYERPLLDENTASTL
jgi:hypothetical protein